MDILSRDIDIILTPLEDESCTHADIVMFKERLFRLIDSYELSIKTELIEYMNKRIQLFGGEYGDGYETAVTDMIAHLGLTPPSSTP